MDTIASASGFATHRAVRVDQDRVELRAGRGGRLFIGALALGCALSSASLLAALADGALQASLLTTLAGATLWLSTATRATRRAERRVFDLRQGRCFKGREDAPEQIIPLPAIRAVQVVEACESHQLSLLLGDGQRATLAGYPRHGLAVADACLISQFLRVPIRIECDQDG